MKHSLIYGLSCFAFLTISNTAFSQTTTPQNVNTINHTDQGNGVNEYEVVPLTPSQNGAYFSHLWWSGDNSFTFVDVPQHVHESTKGNPSFPVVKMTDITTENYGTGGPPPLTYTFLTDVGNSSPRQVLSPGNDIYVQNYRNAVIGDVMYLIVSYGNSGARPINGSLKFELGPHARVANGVLSDHPHFLSNGERWDPNRNECTFENLFPGKERSILIPVDILQNEEDLLELRVDLYKGRAQEHTNQMGIDYYSLSANVAHSHDPNMMLESSDAQNECDYRNGKIHYTVKFQNEGTGPTSYVRVVCQLDNKVDMDRISGIEFPDFYSTHSAGTIVNSHDPGAGGIYHIDKTNRRIIFEMHDLRLESVNDPNLTNLELSRDQVEFDILVKSNYVFGPATMAVSAIYFDKNDPIETNEVQTICGDPVPENQGGGFQELIDTQIKKEEMKTEERLRRP
ncbi:MAG: hypothetical protein AB8B56_07015 [Crocinitomicaceae bacterium]